MSTGVWSPQPSERVGLCAAHWQGPHPSPCLKASGSEDYLPRLRGRSSQEIGSTCIIETCNTKARHDLMSTTLRILPGTYGLLKNKVPQLCGTTQLWMTKRAWVTQNISVVGLLSIITYPSLLPLGTAEIHNRFGLASTLTKRLSKTVA